MEWALGFAEDGVSQKIELLGTLGQQTSVGTDALLSVGIPTSNNQQLKRIAFEGNFSTWHPVCADSYLQAFGVVVPEGSFNRHTVFSVSSPCGVTIHVPALVLMRAFFKPVRQVLPRMFSPSNIDLLSFVDYGCTPPVVVIDDAECCKRISLIANSTSQGKTIQWLQTSRSARGAAQSVHQHAQSGFISFDIPRGHVRIIFHGLLRQEHLYATRASLVTVHVAESDSIASAAEVFHFHAMADSQRTAMASTSDFHVTPRRDGLTDLDQEEWETVEPLLRARKSGRAIYSQREVLNVILHKVATGKTWKTVPKGMLTVVDVTSAFRRWVTDGRMKAVLDYLKESRVVTTKAHRDSGSFISPCQYEESKRSPSKSQKTCLSHQSS